MLLKDMVPLPALGRRAGGVPSSFLSAEPTDGLMSHDIVAWPHVLRGLSRFCLCAPLSGPCWGFASTGGIFRLEKSQPVGKPQAVFS